MATRTWWCILALVIGGACGCASESSPGDGEQNESDGAALDGSAAYDPFAGDMPDFMASAHVQQLDGQLLDLEVLRALFEYGHANPEQAGPWLLLASDSIARGWTGFAVRQYGSALKADPRVSTLPGVLEFLTFVVGNYRGVEKREATALLDTYFGSADDPS